MATLTPSPGEWRDFEERPLSAALGEFFTVCGDAFPGHAAADQWWRFVFHCGCPRAISAAADSRGPLDLHNAAENCLAVFRRAHTDPPGATPSGETSRV